VRRSSETEREGREEDDEDFSKIFKKNKGRTVKYNFVSKHIPNENMPKIKTIELKKNYNFALRVCFKGVKVLKLFQNPTNYAIANKTYLNFTFQMKP
jgi:hypothetical protein